MIIKTFKCKDNSPQKHIDKSGLVLSHPPLERGLYIADPSAPSAQPSLNAEVESALYAAHTFLYIIRPLSLHFSELA